jgi:hypothetical protein
VADLVECYSGTKYAERPAAIHWQGERLAIVSILDRWRAPGGQGFRVQAEDDRVFELRYDEQAEQWEIESIA